MFISELNVAGLRRLSSATVPLAPLTVLIGANGSGKTSVLDALSLIVSSANGELSERVTELGGIGSIATRNGEGKVEITLNFSGGGEGARYVLGLAASGLGHRVSFENLVEDGPNAGESLIRLLLYKSELSGVDARGELRKITGEFHAAESTLLQLSHQEFPLLYKWKSRLASAVHYRPPSVAVNSPIRLPQKVQPASAPGPNSSSLVSLLYSLRESHSSRFETLEATLRAAFDRFRKLEFRPVGGGLMGLAWREEGFEQPFFAHDLSDGQLRFLSLAALLLTYDAPSLLLIDEPEDSLHPELLALLVDLFREASEHSQVIVATHSDRLIRFLQPEEVVAVDLDDSGLAQFTRASDLNLGEWLEDYSLDQLWSKGLLGGRS